MGRIGRSTICSRNTIHLPNAVMDYFNLAIGDQLGWYPGDEEFSATAEFLAVKILRKGGK